MSKLYVFAIGGSGARVLRSFTMLMASGVNLGMDEVVPIIIDPDSSNADLTRTVQLMDDYEHIHQELTFAPESKNRFFRVNIKKILQRHTLIIQDTDNKKFSSFIDTSTMREEDRAMMEMLFSQKNLDATMDVGFKGNPNIGSVVLNQIVASPQFTEFANSFTQGDKIFIISSIFGGTGASGFPLLLKTLRTDKTIPNFNIINNAEIGAVTLLPYFQLKQNEESEIDSSTFISKTKSALAYYEQNIIANNQINALYYLGDDITNTYDNVEGGAGQSNAAHLIEFFASTAIVDFCKSSYSDQSVNKELGIKNTPSGSVSLATLDDNLKEMLRIPLTQFTLMANCIYYKLDTLKQIELARSFDSTFFDGSFVGYIKKYVNDYREWMLEMKNNKRSLDFFNINCGEKPFSVVTEGTVGKVRSTKSNYSLFIDRLNKFAQINGSDNDKLMEIFTLATDKLIKEKIKF